MSARDTFYVCFALYFNTPDTDPKHRFTPEQIMTANIAEKLSKIRSMINGQGVSSVEMMTDDSLSDEELTKHRARFPFPYFQALDCLLPESCFRAKLNGTKFYLTAEDRKMLKTNQDLSRIGYGISAL